MPDETSRVFTVAEVNRAIPSLERRLGGLARRVGRLTADAPRGPEEARRVAREGGRPVPSGYFAVVQEIHEVTRSLQERGVILRDLDRGLVDFPAVLDGRQVFLCWLRGESRVAYFHDPESGFGGRQPLPPEAR